MVVGKKTSAVFTYVSFKLLLNFPKLSLNLHLHTVRLPTNGLVCELKVCVRTAELA